MEEDWGLGFRPEAGGGTIRKGRITEQVSAELPRVRRFVSERRWDEAQLVLGRIESALSAGPAAPSVTGQYRSLSAEVGIVLALEELRDALDYSRSRGELKASEAGDKYAAAYAKYGLDIAALSPPQLARKVTGLPIEFELAAGLDDWVMSATSHTNEPLGEQARKVAAAIDLLDRDPWRAEFRAALRNMDRPELKRLMGTAPDPATRETVYLLGVAAAGHVSTERSARLLGAAQWEHPEDYDLNRFAAYAWALKEDKNLPEGLTYARASLTARPNHTGANQVMASLLAQMGRAQEALPYAEKSLRIKPNSLRAHLIHGYTLNRLGRLDEAIAATPWRSSRNTRWVAATSDRSWPPRG